MQVKTLISILAVGTALAFAGPASAQSINGTVISADDLPKVQARCDELANSASTQSLSEDTKDDSNDANAGAADATVETTPQANEAANATSAIDLDTLSLESCTAAGLSKAM